MENNKKACTVTIKHDILKNIYSNSKNLINVVQLKIKGLILNE